MLHSHTVTHEGHKGIHILEQDIVLFYDIQFKNVLEASKFLKNLEPCEYYIKWKHGPCIGVMDRDGRYYFNGVWFNSTEQAFEYYKIMSIMN